MPAVLVKRRKSTALANLNVNYADRFANIIRAALVVRILSHQSFSFLFAGRIVITAMLAINNTTPAIRYLINFHGLLTFLKCKGRQSSLTTPAGNLFSIS